MHFAVLQPLDDEGNRSLVAGFSESQHAILDELEWLRHDAEISAEQRDRAVNEFIDLVAAVDGILQAQAKADASYFTSKCGRPVHAMETEAIVCQR